MNTRDPRDNPSEALRLMKETHERPHSLSRAEQLRVVSTMPDLGYPSAAETPAGKRGPKSKRTQYDDALDRRKEPYRLLVKLPRASAAGAIARRVIGHRMIDLIKDVAEGVLKSKVKPIHHVRLIRESLERKGRRVPDDKTIRQALRALGLRK